MTSPSSSDTSRLQPLPTLASLLTSTQTIALPLELAMTRLDAFSQTLSPHNAHLSEVSGLGPTVVGPSTEQGYVRLRQDLAVVPMPDRERLRVSGRDRASFLHGLLTQDIASLAPGAGCYSAFLDIKGKMQVDLRIAVREDDFLIELPWERGAAFAAALDGYLFREKVKLHVESDSHAAILLAGPALSSPRLGLSLPETLHGWTSATLAGHPVDVVRSNWLEPAPSLTVWVETPHLSAVMDHLLEVAEGLGGGLASTAALEQARLEAGVPRHFVDTDVDTIPLEAPLHNIIHFAKGCYLGQEVIARVDSRGAVNRHLVGLVLEQEAEVGSELKAGPEAEKPGKVLGTLTTVGQSPSSGRWLALGWVRRGFKEPGTQVDVASGGSARVTELPFDEGRASAT